VPRFQTVEHRKKLHGVGQTSSVEIHRNTYPNATLRGEERATQGERDRGEAKVLAKGVNAGCGKT
jgi:hypothetical protein